VDDEVRIAELLTALSLASDLGQGQPMDWELRGCLLALGLAERLDVDSVERRTVYDLALLRYIGCTSHAHEVALVFGDEIDARRRLLAFDLADKGAMLRTIVGTAGAGLALPRRIATVAATLAAGSDPVDEGFRASCEVAATFGRRLGFGDDVNAALAFAFERWDGH
jgi:hypothetical protein